MKATERGLALLTCYLGDPERKFLSVAQFRNLAKIMQNHAPRAGEGELQVQDLKALGLEESFAQRVVELLSQEAQLDWYLGKAKLAGCTLITRLSPDYPLAVRKRLGLDCPGCLWAKGDPEILKKPGIALVGSRELAPENAEFARQAGLQAARQGYILISGNARGADQTAQEAALENGGQVISVVADRLDTLPLREGVLYLSEEAFDRPFSAMRALSRNRVIHSLGCLTLVSQCTLKKGGTWDGTVKNLKGGWSPVLCYADGSESVDALVQLGAQPVSAQQLQDLQALHHQIPNLFETI